MKKRIIVSSTVFLFAILLVATSYIYFSTDIEKIKKTFEKRYSVLVLGDEDEIIGVQINKEEQLHLKSTNPIPKKLEITVLTFEDKNFYTHNGVDIKAIFRALKNNLLLRRTSGASTITMQVAKLYKIKSRNIFNKYLEIIQALKIDKNLSKEDILKLYLNNAPYGGNIVGYRTAAHLYFQKEPLELTWAEGALLAVLPNSPSLINVEKNSNKLLDKRNRLLKELYDRKIIDETQYELSLQEPIPTKRYAFTNLVPHLTRRFSNEVDSKIISSTINSGIQKNVQSAVENYTFQMNRFGLKNIVALVIDNKTYEVKAYVGSQDFFDEKTNGQVDGIIAKRATGSVLKPFLFANSIDAGLIAPGSKIIDVPTYFYNFYPKNANGKYYGMIEAENALAKSLNIPFIYLLKEFGEDKFFFFLKRVLGFNDNNYSRYGLSLILGTKELSVEDIGVLYSGLANYGNFRQLKYLRNEEEIYKSKIISEDYLSDGASYLTLKTLAKVERPGIEKLYMNKKNISWKTGTSEGQRDAWACGVTPDWTVIAWVGNFTGESNPNLSGVETAGALLFNIFNTLTRNPPSFTKPTYDLEEIKVDATTGYSLDYDLPSKTILFPIKSTPLRTSPFYKKVFINPKTGEEIDSRDTEFSKRQEKISLNYPVELLNYYIREGKDISQFYSSKNKIKGLKILYPSNKLKIKVPKDFDGEQKLIVKIANIKNKKLYWYLDKNYLGVNNNREMGFSLKKGKYIITIISEDMEIEKVQFEIVK